MKSWVLEALGTQRVMAAIDTTYRQKLAAVFGTPKTVQAQLSEQEILFVAGALEVEIVDRLEDDGDNAECRPKLAKMAFQLRMGLPLPDESLSAAEEILRRACLAVLADRAPDAKRLLSDTPWPTLPLNSSDWGTRVRATVLDTWLRIFRKAGWGDFDLLQKNIAELRRAQSAMEPNYLQSLNSDYATEKVWALVASYHLAKAAEILGTYSTQGASDGTFDIREQLETQFSRAAAACQRGQLAELELKVHVLGRASQHFVANSLWTLVRGQPGFVSHFVKSLTGAEIGRPIFEVLPPQRQALRENGLLGAGHRAIVVSLPTSSGKTLIAQFRILTALSQFADDNGWVAYVAPTRALVNQVATRLRKDFGPLGIVVEKVSPALEVDGIEAGVLMQSDLQSQFRVLVSTPEKLELMLRGGWIEEIKRPLALIVVDEAHNLAETNRGIKLELLLALINRECRHARFLLLTPFISNAKEIASWLSPDSNQAVELGIDWTPNDRAIVLATTRKATGHGRGAFHLEFTTLHTSQPSIDVNMQFASTAGRPLNLSYSDVKGSAGKLAAAVANFMRARGTVIILTRIPDDTWPVASLFLDEPDLINRPETPETRHLLDYFRNEYGAEFPLSKLLSQGIGVHHAGLSDEARSIVEWLAECGHLKLLVATTTLAQGVNFPVSGVVFASRYYPAKNRSIEMPPEDFWNIAGRVGRVDQGDLGLIAIVGQDDDDAKDKVSKFVTRNVNSLNSTLITLVSEWFTQYPLLEMRALADRPEWSGFLQYLAHTYRQIGNHNKFVDQIELVLRGTLGFHALRKRNSAWARRLIVEVQGYASGLHGKPLSLVDSTGFSWESVSRTLAKLNDARIREDVWDSGLYDGRSQSLAKLMGILLQVPELRDSLTVASGLNRDGKFLANVVRSWVHGASLERIAAEFFDKDKSGATLSKTDSLTSCCKTLFGKIIQTTSWGLAALQSLTWKDDFDKLPEEQQRHLRNIPAKAFYGVNDDRALMLRLLGVPRQAATPLVELLNVNLKDPLPEVRQRLRQSGMSLWQNALGELGPSYYHAWKILEGES